MFVATANSFFGTDIAVDQAGTAAAKTKLTVYTIHLRLMLGWFTMCLTNS